MAKYKKHISTINMMLEQDRTEFRSHKDRLFTVSQLVITILLGAFALIVSSNMDNTFVILAILVGIIILLGYYVILYIVYNNHIKDIRRAIEMRELYIEDFKEFKKRGYTPIGNTDNVPDPKYKEREPWIYLVSVSIFWIFVFTVLLMRLSDVQSICNLMEKIIIIN